jgi:hypothetical protein
MSIIVRQSTRLRPGLRSINLQFGLKIMRFAVLSVGLVVTILLLFATKPSQDDFDRELAALVREAISSRSYDDAKGLASNLIAVGCKLRTDDCLTVLKKTYSVSSTDYLLFSRRTVTGPRATLQCWGLLKQFICAGDLTLPSVHDGLNSIL